jgi:murein DD-endopeptidase MepM/ murein hydrolase activator NlpD
MIAQNLESSLSKRRVRLISAILALPLFGIVAAFGIAPSTRTESVQVQVVEQDLTLPKSLVAVDEAGQTIYSRQDLVRRGDTVSALLSRMQADDPEAVEFLKTDNTAKAIYRTLVPGRVVETRVTDDGELLGLRMRMSSGSVLKVFKIGGELTSLEETLPLDKRLIFKSGRITSSLFAATDSADIPDSIATQLAKLFATEIDFHHDLHKDDQFAVAYEAFYDGADLIRAGRLVAAEFINRGEAHRLVYYEDGIGDGDYFTPEGKSLKRAFLRSPLEFSRVSSGFSMARLHPISGEWRAHRGVDFPAPTGTPILATCEGTVEFAGQQNGYGNVIELKHYGQFGTLYAHLSAFASSVRKGAQVKQGQIIGYVGTTGWSTGPHLHYEFKVAGVQQDPQGNAVPIAMPVVPGFKAIFELTAKPMFAQLDMMRETASAVNFE